MNSKQVLDKYNMESLNREQLDYIKKYNDIQTRLMRILLYIGMTLACTNIMNISIKSNTVMDIVVDIVTIILLIATIGIYGYMSKLKYSLKNNIERLK